MKVAGTAYILGSILQVRFFFVLENPVIHTMLKLGQGTDRQQSLCQCDSDCHSSFGTRRVI